MLAPTGIRLHTVVVADDRNLRIARDFHMHTITQTNDLGRKVNDGFEYACRHNADFVAFIGSDDWLHEDLFAPLAKVGERILSGHEITVVDLIAGQLRRLGPRGRYGVPPWFIPRRLLKPCGYRPVTDLRRAGMEGEISRGLQRAEWTFHDPHPLARVDFKTDVNITPYRALAGSLGYGSEETPWGPLAERYPVALVGMARDLHERMTASASSQTEPFESPNLARRRY